MVEPMSDPSRLIVAITGASGSIYGIRALQLLKDSGIEAHLVVSKWGARTLQHETGWALKDVQALAAQYGGGLMLNPATGHPGLAATLLLPAADLPPDESAS